MSRRSSAGLFVLFLVAFVAVAWAFGERDWRVAWLIPLIVVAKFALSTKEGEPSHRAALGLNVAVVVPVYNEDEAILRRTLHSVLTQTRPPTTVHVVDDGSPTDAAYRLAQRLAPSFQKAGIRFRITKQSVNRGKREALVAAFEKADDADVYVCIDSDTQLNRTALGHLVSPFGDPGVTAATGIVLPANHDHNVLTRLMDLRYAGAFLFGRASYSAVGSVLCCSGAFSAFRGWVVRAHLSDFVNQRVRGRPVTIGDDRRLTNYCLLEGRAVFVRHAVAETTVPSSISQYVHQQSRWNKSFIRESLWCVRNMPYRKPAFYLNMFELTMWLLFTAMIVPAFVVAVAVGPRLLLNYLLISSVMAYLQATRYFEVTGVKHRPTPEKVGIFLIAPVYGLIHLLLMVPLRFWSLFTMASTGWGTRRKVMGESPAADGLGPA